MFYVFGVTKAIHRRNDKNKTDTSRNEIPTHSQQTKPASSGGTHSAKPDGGVSPQPEVESIPRSNSPPTEEVRTESPPLQTNIQTTNSNSDINHNNNDNVTGNESSTRSD